MMKAPQVCFFLGATHLGGAERSIVDLASGISPEKHGFSPWILLPKSNGPLVSEIQSRKLDFDILEMPERFLKVSRKQGFLKNKNLWLSLPELNSYSFRLIKLLKEKKPALVHANGLKPNLLATLTSPFHKIPVLWHLRDILAPGSLYHLSANLAKQFGVHVVANSKASAATLPKAFIDADVVYNGFDPNKLQAQKNRNFNSQLGIPTSAPIVGFVAALSRWKGPFEFVEMAAKLKEKITNIGFVIVGGEIYDTHSETGVLQQLKKRVEELNLTDSFVFTGFLSNINEAVNGFDVFAHCSNKPEPFGRVIVEAMGLEVPVVAAGEGGVLEIVEPGNNGLLFKPGDSGDLARQVTRILENENLRQMLVENGKTTFLKKFTLEKHVQGILGVYKKCLV